jgi:hypothetical protein
VPITTPNFSYSQPLGDPSVISLEDTSTGSDGLVTERRVFLTKADGSYLVPEENDEDYIVWPIADDTIDIDALDKDYALNVVVLWVNAAGTALYTKAQKIGFTQWNEEFDYSLTQLQSGNPALTHDGNFFNLKSDLRTEIDSGNQCVLLAVDLYGAQNCYDAATLIRLKASVLFSGTFN